ncbi:MAG: ABC transporter permease [Chloroflexota bacterium]
MTVAETAHDDGRVRVAEGGPAARATVTVLATIGLLFLGLPVLALVLRAFTSGTIGGTATGPLLTALALSLWTSLVAIGLVVLFGAPVAWILARRRFRGKAFVETLVDLPIVLPPSVAGLALLLVYGRRGLLGGALDVAGVSIAFSTIAVLLAQAFVAAPFFIRATRTGLLGVSRELEEAAAVDGAAPSQVVRRITIPLAAPALGAGLVLAWARALGEFGATIMFAGNLEGRTQTLPLLVYTEFQGSLDAAVAAATVLIVAALGVLIAVRLTHWRAVL